MKANKRASLRDYVREIYLTLQPTEKVRNQKHITFTYTGAALLMAITAAGMTVMNFYRVSLGMAAVTGALTVIFLLCAYLYGVRKLEVIPSTIGALCVMVAICYFALTGQLEGFSILWMLLLPLVGTGLFEPRVGFCLSMFFLLFNTVLFYTPLRAMVEEYYTEPFLTRFPVLYFCMFLISMSSFMQKEKYSRALYLKSQMNELGKNRAEEENSQLKEQMQETQQIFRIVSDHSDRILYNYNLATGVTSPWDAENAKKDILAHLYTGTYQEESLELNKAIVSEEKGDIKRFFADIHGGVPSGEVNVHVRMTDGTARWYHLKYSTIFHHGKPESAIISAEDITVRHEHELAYLRIRQSTENTAESSLICVESDLTADCVEHLSGLALEGIDMGEGYTHVELGGKVLAQNFAYVEEDAARAYFSREAFLAAYAEGVREKHSEWQVRYLDGSEHWLDTHILLVEDPYNQHIKLFMTMQDMTEKKNAQMEILARSERDGLTGLYNRHTTEEMIRARLGDESQGIFVILDLDYLKQINDGFGHSEGDRAIVSVAQILKTHFRSSDIIGRIGGDEFVVYMPGAAENRETMKGVFTMLLRKLGSLSIGKNGEMAITCSVGCVVEEKGLSYDALYRRADRALYHVKKNGRNNFAFYDPEMENETFVLPMDKLFTLDQAKRSENRDVQDMITALSEYYHLVLCCNITENSYHRMQEVEDGIFAMMPTFGKMDNMVTMSEMRMTAEDAKRFDDAVSRRALLEAGERGDKHVTVYFDFQDVDGKYYPAECTSILYHNENGDLCEFALIRWRR